MNLDISIIVPVYNEEESLPELNRWIAEVLENKYTYEVLYIDDGSSDKSWAVINQLVDDDTHARGIRFTRNYGKSAALDTGFTHATGEVIITMDADLQDSPEEIIGLYNKIKKEGYDLISGWKKKRYDPISKTIPSKFFNYVTRKMTGIPLHDFNCGLKAYYYRVAKSVRVYGEMHRYIPVLAKWNGYRNIGEMVVQHRARKYGVTKFGLERFINGFLDLLSVTFVTRFKQRPMHFFGTLGVLSFVLGFFGTMAIIFNKIYHLYYQLPVREVTDQPLFYLSLVTLIIGVQLFLTGFLAEMISISTMKKNPYLIEEIIGVKSTDAPVKT